MTYNRLCYIADQYTHVLIYVNITETKILWNNTLIVCSKLSYIFYFISCLKHIGYNLPKYSHNPLIGHDP